MLEVLSHDVVHGAAGEGQQGQLARGQPDEHLQSNKNELSERLRESRFR